VSEEKPFEPTTSRLQKAKREGDVARTQELSGTIAFACALGASLAAVPAIGAQAKILLDDVFISRNAAPAFAASIALTMVPALAAAAGACASACAQAGGLQLTAITVKTERLNPAENLKRMLSREAAVSSARAFVAFVCAGAALAGTALAVYGSVLHGSGAGATAAAAWSGAIRTSEVLCLIGAIFSAADYGAQFKRWRKRLRMSHEELTRDQKEQDGDPHARGRRRALHRRISRASIARVKDAAFVITNPPHIAVALEYRPPDVPVPRVLVRAADEAAARVREAASSHGIPLVENVPLARSLYASTSAGDFIPQETYLAVAEIVSRLQRVFAEKAGDA
jgi:flagellar biosynthesis protein FlhB